MNKFIARTLIITMFLSLVFPVLPAQAQNDRQGRTQTGRRGQTTRSGRADATTENQSLETQDQLRPDWVKSAPRRSLTPLTAMREKLALKDVATDLTLRSAEQDDLGQTHRLRRSVDFPRQRQRRRHCWRAHIRCQQSRDDT